MQFYPISANYTLEQHKPVVTLWGRDSEGKKKAIIHRGIEPYFWIIPRNGEKEAIAQLRVSQGGFVDF